MKLLIMLEKYKALMVLEIIVLDIVPPKVDPKVALVLSALTKITIDQ